MRHNLDLGQHFMINSALLNKVVESGDVNSDEVILEVGSGEGALTNKILEKNPKKIICVEIDSRLKIENKQVEFIEGNILEKIDELKFDNFIANIPYHISEPLLIKLITKRTDKITIVCGKKFYEVLLGETILGLITRSYYAIELIEEISPESFNPPPKTDSALITLRAKETDELLLTFYEHQKQKVKNYLLKISEGRKSKKEIKNHFGELEDILDKQLYTLDYNNYKQLYTFINNYLL